MATINELLAAEVKARFKTQEDAAKAFGINRSYLCLMLSGKRPVSDKVLEALGYKRVVNVSYVRVAGHG